MQSITAKAMVIIMKDRIVKILLIVIIILHAAAPFIELARVGYDSLSEMLWEVYDNGVVVALSAAVLRLYNSK